MTEKEVGIFIGALDRWIRNAITQRLNPTGGTGEWENDEISECQENIAAVLLHIAVAELPKSLQFTAEDEGTG